MPSVTLPIKTYQRRASRRLTFSGFKSHKEENKRRFHKSYEFQEPVEHSKVFMVAFAAKASWHERIHDKANLMKKGVLTIYSSSL